MKILAHQARSSSPSTAERKKQLRDTIANRSRRLAPEWRDRAEASIRERVLALPEIASASSVLVCASHGAEPETRDLIQRLEVLGKKVFVPRADREEIDQTIEAAIFVGPAFDPTGARLGHGNGYVDRYLSAHPTFAIGICFESELLPEIPVATHDVPMSVIVTERRTLRTPDDPHEALRTWLGLDHAEIDGLLRLVLAGDDFDSETYDRFRERLLRHIGVEERILFPLSRERGTASLASRLAELRIDHAALTTLLVPTPDIELAREIASLLARHNELEETNGGVYDSCLAVLSAEQARDVVARARARKPVPTTSYFDGHGTVRTAQEALAKARRRRGATTATPG